MSSLEKAFGQAMRERRRELGISQEELSFRANVHRTYISQLERGIKSPSLKVIELIAQALNMSGSRLVERAENLFNVSSSHADTTTSTDPAN